MKEFKIAGFVLVLLSIMPFAHADIAPGPELVVIPLIFLVIIGAIIAGIIYLAYRILKWIKNKQTKK